MKMMHLTRWRAWGFVFGRVAQKWKLFEEMLAVNLAGHLLRRKRPKDIEWGNEKLVISVVILRRLVEAGTFPNPRDVEMFAASPYPYEQKF